MLLPAKKSAERRGASKTVKSASAPNGPLSSPRYAQLYSSKRQSPVLYLRRGNFLPASSVTVYTPLISHDLQVREKGQYSKSITLIPPAESTKALSAPRGAPSFTVSSFDMQKYCAFF